MQYAQQHFEKIYMQQLLVYILYQYYNLHTKCKNYLITDNLSISTCYVIMPMLSNVLQN